MPEPTTVRAEGKTVIKDNVGVAPKAARAPKTAIFRSSSMADKSFGSYLARLPDDQRGALQRLREIIHAAAPDAEEYVGYGLAAFRLNGRPLVGLGASARHCSLHPMDGTTVAAMADDLAAFETSKGTIRFTPDRPLPAALVKKIVKRRIAQNAAAPRARSK
jgi:uncharacterized protein YdhG (YjbR/CyaY superfamily)